MARLRYSSLDGELDVAVSGSDGTLSSPDFAALPVVASPDYLPIILDPFGDGGAPEIVYVTAHTSADTSVTVLRGQEQGHGAPAGRAHGVGTIWHHGPTAGEFVEDIHGGVHTSAGTPIRLDARVVALQIDANIAALTDTAKDHAVVTLVLAQGSTGGTWASHTGVAISWEAGAPPTLSSTAGNYDVIELTRVQQNVSTFLGRVVTADATYAPA